MKHLTLLFLVKDGEVLLALKKRGFGEGRWNGVGGKIEAGESTKQAMIRECQEEIKVTPVVYEKVAELTFDEQHNGDRDVHFAEVFIVTKWEGEPTETDEMKPKWFRAEEIPYKDMWPDDQFWLEKVLSGIKLIGSFHLNDKDEVIDHHMHEVEVLNA